VRAKKGGYLLYSNNRLKEELAAITFVKPSIGDHAREGSLPRRMRVLLPPLDQRKGIHSH